MTDNRNLIEKEIQVVGIVKSAGYYFHGKELAAPNLYAYETTGFLGLTQAFECVVWEGTLFNCLTGPFIVLPETASYYRTHEFFQSYVIAEPFGKDILDDIYGYVSEEDTSQVRCFVAMEDFAGIEYSNGPGIVNKIGKDIAEGTLTCCIFVHSKDDPINAELIVIDPKAKVAHEE